jgi:LuxR family transcriptional regulator of csgAB operon
MQQVVLMGRASLLNQVIAYFIGNELAVPCMISSTPLHLFPLAEISGFEDLHSGATDYLFLIDCSDRDMVEATDEITSNPELNGHIIALYNLSDYSDFEAQALCREVRGFFYVHDSPEIFLKGIKAMFKGEVWISKHILWRHIQNHTGDRLVEHTFAADLTRREQQILSLVSIGVNNDEIAEKLCVSVNTVKTHMYNIFKKLQVTNRLQAALWAAKNL